VCIAINPQKGLLILQGIAARTKKNLLLLLLAP